MYNGTKRKDRIWHPFPLMVLFDDPLEVSSSVFGKNMWAFQHLVWHPHSAVAATYLEVLSPANQFGGYLPLSHVRSSFSSGKLVALFTWTAHFFFFCTISLLRSGHSTILFVCRRTSALFITAGLPRCHKTGPNHDITTTTMFHR